MGGVLLLYRFFLVTTLSLPFVLVLLFFFSCLFCLYVTFADGTTFDSDCNLLIYDHITTYYAHYDLIPKNHSVFCQVNCVGHRFWFFGFRVRGASANYTTTNSILGISPPNETGATRNRYSVSFVTFFVCFQMCYLSCFLCGINWVRGGGVGWGFSSCILYCLLSC